ncbi:MAG: hypothetical protein J6T72_04560, partial [Alphaproteobacteria bacterium]|nr:hypothetical protein [Alphaproteobacteria bacterium]
MDKVDEFDIFGTGPESRQKHETLMKFLDRERQNNPQEVTQREIDLINRLDENSCMLFNPLEI